MDNIPITQQLIEWAYELERYYYGDLEDADSADWLRNVNELNQKIANEVRWAIVDASRRESAALD